MIQYITLQEQIDADFDRARRRAILRRVRDRLLNRPAPATFEEFKKSLGALNQISRGIKAVEVDKISGSVGRSRDFDGAFLPARQSVAARWKRIDRAFHRTRELPPVSLYKLGDSYFVRDGNHRVSVARYHGVEMMDAEVVEILPHAPAPPPLPRPARPGWPSRLKDRLGSLQPWARQPGCDTPCGP